MSVLFIKKKKSHNNKKKMSVLVVLQDYTDADNFISLTDVLKNVPEDQRVILIVVGRRADLSHPPLTPMEGLEQRGPGWLTEQLPEDPVEDVDRDSVLCYLDGARRMRSFLESVGVFGRVSSFVVDPTWFIPVSPSPLSHSAHVHDYLFDRCDLVGGHLGQFVTTAQYLELTEALAAESDPQRRRACSREIIQAAAVSPSGSSCSLFRDQVPTFVFVGKRVEMLLLAPLTGAAEVLEHILSADSAIAVRVFAQLFAYNNLSLESKNLTLNQFNADADPTATVRFLEALERYHERDIITYYFPTK